ncbi:MULTISPECIES: helix-turn-helix transcriptional regulator [unclassified Nocardioides]|uniref:helix-turn-helix transcriptional regulator n=1 Tax=unclassified Nocardioides TaxID=2615069 RepID=UPI0036108D61
MLETSARLLRLLSLLQSRPDWTGHELADRLEVTTRTIRNDVGRLRELGYPVEARSGVAGGYRLGPGGSLPPLLLDDEEAVAVAVGLRTAAGSAVAGIEDASLRALMKLQQVLPSRLRHRTRAFEAALQAPAPGPLVDGEILTMLAGACRDREVVRLDYQAHDGRRARRRVEPYRLVSHRRRWYLVAWDLDRDGWRTFRVDRITPRTPTGPRFTPRLMPPDAEVVERVQRAAGEAMWRFRARVVVHAPAAHVRARMPIPVDVDELAEDRCAFEPGSDDPRALALWLGFLDADFEVESEELGDALRALADRLRRAAG